MTDIIILVAIAVLAGIIGAVVGIKSAKENKAKQQDQNE